MTDSFQESQLEKSDLQRNGQTSKCIGSTVTIGYGIQMTHPYHKKNLGGHESILVGRVEGGSFAHKIPVRDVKVSYEYV